MRASHVPEAGSSSTQRWPAHTELVSRCRRDFLSITELHDSRLLQGSGIPSLLHAANDSPPSIRECPTHRFGKHSATGIAQRSDGGCNSMIVGDGCSTRRPRPSVPARISVSDVHNPPADQDAANTRDTTPSTHS